MRIDRHTTADDVGRAGAIAWRMLARTDRERRVPGTASTSRTARPNCCASARALELSGAQLRLQINERAFHLDVQDLLPRLEDKVGGPSIS